MGMQIQAGMWDQESPKGDDLALAETRERVPATKPASVLRLVYLDYRRHRAAGARSALPVILLTQGFWASAVFRISHWAIGCCRIPGLRTLIKAASVLGQKFMEILTGICLPARCDIGPGLYIGHFGGIFIDSESHIGENCNLAQGVTIGKGGRGELHGVPSLGDRVHVGANAVILGQITIGDDAVIGPNAVVMNPIPPRGVAMGNPARIVGMSGSFEFGHYDGMENDPARRLALENQDPELAPEKKREMTHAKER